MADGVDERGLGGFEVGFRLCGEFPLATDGIGEVGERI